jgi:hypothetical protein
MFRRLLPLAAATVLTVAAISAQTPVATMPVDAIRPGMVGTGRTVFAGERLEDFHATIVGVLKNVVGPKRDLIVAKLDGGPLASTGVIAGMSGSPVYIDGKLIGAVSYQMGTFPKEPFAGITPIGEMIGDVDGGGPRPLTRDGLVSWPASPAEVYAAIGKLIARGTAGLSAPGQSSATVSETPLGAIAAGLRPIGAAIVLGGFDPAVGEPLARALSAGIANRQTPGVSTTVAPFQPGDAIGVSLVRGDLDIGATGTVTMVDGSRVYAFGHPFLDLGPTKFAMTKATVLGVLPSLDTSLKIATLGPVVGAVTQDRSAAIGGILGPPPPELAVTMTLSSDRAPERRFSFFVAQDPLLTPLFTYAAVLNALTSYERTTGAMSVGVTGTLSFGADGQLTIDDVFSSDSPLPGAAAVAAMPISAAASNEFKSVMAQSLDLRIRTSERQDNVTIERAWLDTTAPKPGATVNVQVLLRHYRGDSETISVPVTMPATSSGPLTLLVSDAPTLAALEQRELNPVRPTSFAGMLAEMNNTRRNNRLYVRLLTSRTGAVVAGQPMPTLPASVQSVLDADKSVATSSLSRAIVGAWEQRLDRAVRGSREIPVTLAAR